MGASRVTFVFKVNVYLVLAVGASVASLAARVAKSPLSPEEDPNAEIYPADWTVTVRVARVASSPAAPPVRVKASAVEITSAITITRGIISLRLFFIIFLSFDILPAWADVFLHKIF